MIADCEIRIANIAIPHFAIPHSQKWIHNF